MNQATTGHGHTRCTPARLFEITVLDTTGTEARWHTVGWGIGRQDADALARSYVTRPLCPYERARVTHNGRLLAEHRRPAL
ncbi:hypothetical protein [Nonomuraea cavernae]|uniref:Uncharacterized protein n=1 Tax=Nonomuraea cavernae TaxID=2045107 RepID=A0A917YQB8_9ACTN|nr:hypothetical protein [Nonomuraea cavernae]MCA2183943.1 hypothetical protein [Nonomuraea cavernae]GGO61849.1 hypothetical protein GCM10012289_05060 [Nonomuraea cavernae]